MIPEHCKDIEAIKELSCTTAIMRLVLSRLTYILKQQCPFLRRGEIAEKITGQILIFGLERMGQMYFQESGLLGSRNKFGE